MTDRLKILQVAHSYAPDRDGVAEVVRRLSEGLVRRGHEVHVATSHSPNRSTREISGVDVESFALRGNWSNGIAGSAREQRRYTEHVTSPEWNVRSFHHGRVWSLDLVLDVLPELPGVNVYTPHGLPGLASAEWKPYYDRIRTLFAALDAVVCLSETFEEKPFADAAGLSNAVVIPNGVDPDEFGRAPLGVRSDWKLADRPVVLSVSNHSPLKGHDLLARLAVNLPGCTVVNVGNGYPAEKGNLGRFGVRGGCYYRCHVNSVRQNNFVLKKNVARPAVVSAFHEADVFVLPSYREASPLVILEAMAAGLPWVSTDVGNVREHAGGLVVDGAAEMADAVRAILHDPQLRSRLSDEGRLRVAERHSWETIIDEYERLYLELHARQRRAGGSDR